LKTFTLTNELWLPQSPEEVFPFFADAGKLERLTPPSLRFQILTPPPIEMAVGALIDYRITLRGIPMRWQSEITAWEPPYRFVDEQRRGPYRLWVHEHVFIPQRGAAQDGGTLAKDIVQYAVLGGTIVQRLFVAAELERIFEYRNAALIDYFAAGAPE
jgi:ligand-binding SRPBCC domain-containing protein